MRVRFVLLLVMLLVGCTRAPQRPFTVAAAASMQRPLQAIAAAFTEQTGQAVTLSLGATGTLAAQLEQGAPFDLFLAADEATPKRLAEKGLLTEVHHYATGQLVLAVSPQGAPISSLQDLAQPSVKRIAIANPEQAPYGKAAVEALKAAGVWAEVERKLVLGESIRQAAQFVESGNVDAGLLARSDAGSLVTAPVPGTLYTPIHQALGLVVGSPHEATAKQFAQFLSSPEARRILTEFGFLLGGD